LRSLFVKGVSPAGARLWLLITGILWSTSGILIKLIPWNPMAISALRSLIAAAVLWAYMRPKRIRFNKRTIAGGIFLGLCLTAFVAANKLTTSANAIMLQYTSPIFTLVLSALILKTSIKKSDIAIMLMAMGGIALFFFEKLTAGGMAGNLLALFSGISYSFVYILCSRFGDDAIHGLFLGNMLSFVIGLPFIIADPPSFTATSAAALVGMGIFQLGLPYVIFGEVMRYSTPFDATIITMIEPLLNPVWVFAFTGETPGALAITGGVIVLAAIVVKAWLGANPGNGKEQPIINSEE
jgi:drug/metabolite transporter (DMT)-like permease